MFEPFIKIGVDARTEMTIFLRFSSSFDLMSLKSKQEIYLFIFPMHGCFACNYVHAPHSCLMPREARGITDDCELPCRVLGVYHALLKEQTVSLTTGPSLQPKCNVSETETLFSGACPEDHPQSYNIKMDAQPSIFLWQKYFSNISLTKIPGIQALRNNSFNV